MILGLTGGIASGKTLLGSYFKEAGFTIIEADDVARVIFDAHKKEIAKLLGLDSKYLNQNNLGKNNTNILTKKQLDLSSQLFKDEVRDVIFKDSRKRQLLNDFIHPKAKERFVTLKNNNPKDNLLIFDIPLLFEASWDDLCDAILTIYSDEKIQVARLKKRNGFDEKLALKMIHSQLKAADKLKRSDFIIANNGTVEELKNAFLIVVEELRKIQNEI